MLAASEDRSHLEVCRHFEQSVGCVVSSNLGVKAFVSNQTVIPACVPLAVHHCIVALQSASEANPQERAAYFVPSVIMLHICQHGTLSGDYPRFLQSCKGCGVDSCYKKNGLRQ